MDVAVTDSATPERAALRHRRDRLTARSALLFAEAERLANSDDREALRIRATNCTSTAPISSPTITRWNSFTCGSTHCASRPDSS